MKCNGADYFNLTVHGDQATLFFQMYNTNFTTNQYSLDFII